MTREEMIGALACWCTDASHQCDDTCPFQDRSCNFIAMTDAELNEAYDVVFPTIALPSPTPTIKDSGDRREFSTGAVRDMAEGKGDMVSMPNAAILRLSKHYENGAIKYGRWNYTKGIPVSSFLDSALRHLFKYLDGWDDEDHLSAAAFNVLGAMEMEAHHKELIDIPNREGKNCFDYEQKPFVQNNNKNEE